MRLLAGLLLGCCLSSTLCFSGPTVNAFSIHCISHNVQSRKVPIALAKEPRGSLLRVSSKTNSYSGDHPLPQSGDYDLVRATDINRHLRIQQLRRIFFRVMMPALGMIAGFNHGLPSWMAQTSIPVMKLALLLFMGGVGNKLADAIDDDNLWGAPKESRYLHRKVAPQLLTLALHLNTAAAFIASSMCSNPVPSAMLTGMYARSWIIKDKVQPNFSKKAGEAVVACVVGPLFWAAIGAKMRHNTALFPISMLATFFTCVWWLEHGRHKVKNKKIAMVATETGLFRLVPVACLACLPWIPITIRMAFLTGAAVSFSEIFGYSLCKHVLIPRCGPILKEHGIRLSGLFWSLYYILVARREGGLTYSHGWVVYNLVWEFYYTFLRVINREWRRLIICVMCLLTDMIMFLCVLGRAGFLNLVPALGLASITMVGIRKLQPKILTDQIDGIFLLSSFVAALFEVHETSQIAKTDPTGMNRLLLWLLTMGDSVATARFFHKFSVDEEGKQFDWFSPLLVLNVAQGIVEWWKIILW